MSIDNNECSLFFLLKQILIELLLLKTNDMANIKIKELDNQVCAKVKHNGNETVYNYTKGEMPDELDAKLIEIFGERPIREERN